MSADDSPPTHLSDPALMRALAHPARFSVLERLSEVDELTATECATLTGLSPSAMSYHLRELAKVQIIEEAPGRGDGRERVWRLRQRNFMIGPALDADDEGRQAAAAMVAAIRAAQDSNMDEWLSKIYYDSPEWFDAATISTWTLLLAPEELTELVTAMRNLIDPYLARNRRGAADLPSNARRVAMQFRAHPLADDPKPTT